MTNEHVIIIGGSSGIGLATARHLLGAGYKVTIAGRSRERLDAALSGLSGRAEGAVLDATDPEAVERFFGKAGSFAHLVLALSGNKGAGPFSSLDMQDLATGFSQKVVAQMRCAQAALGHIDPAGSITFVSAVSAQAAAPGLAGIGAINGALLAATPALAVELQPLRVNAVTPGVIDTPWWDMLPRDQKAGAFAMFADKSLAGRIGSAEEVAAVIALLVGNGFITGETISCDGGLRFAA